MSINYCINCPLRLFNTKCHNLHGVGNPWSGNCVIIPNVDYDAYKKRSLNFGAQLKILEDILSTGDLKQTTFVVPLIRCNETISCKVNDEIINNCYHYFLEEQKLFRFRNIHLMGSSVKRVLDINISDNLNNVYLYRNTKFTVNYSPLTKLIEKNKNFDTLVEYFIKWINSCKSNSFYEYNQIII